MKIEWTNFASQFFDETLPNWVKNRYIPNKKLKDRPFSDKDVQFFSDSIVELSEMLTEERSQTFKQSKQEREYLNHPRFRSSYLLYFFPLQASKFYLLFQKHEKALKTLLMPESPKGTIRIADWGSGPGTASFALFFTLLRWFEKNPEKFENHPGFEFTWIDGSFPMMKDGQNMLVGLIKQLNLPFSVRIQVVEADVFHQAKKPLKSDLSIVGNVLNEANKSTLSHFFEHILHPENQSVLFLEPALKNTSQKLSELRNEAGLHIIGPCLHSGVCPLTHGRDWCHFSEKFEVPGRWFQAFTKELGSSRDFLKFSYLWLSRVETPRLAPEDSRLVLSDPVFSPDGQKASLLLCEPNEVLRLPIQRPEKTKNKRELSYRGKILSAEELKGLRLAPLRGPAVRR